MEKAEVLSNFFSSIFTDDPDVDGKILRLDKTRLDYQITEDMVLKQLKN